MVERLLFFHVGKFRVKACSFYDITRKGRKGVRLTCLKAGGCGTNRNRLLTEKITAMKKALRKEGRNETEKSSSNDWSISCNN